MPTVVKCKQSGPLRSWSERSAYGAITSQRCHSSARRKHIHKVSKHYEKVLAIGNLEPCQSMSMKLTRFKRQILKMQHNLPPCLLRVTQYDKCREEKENEEDKLY
eukprot:g48443.t1